MFEHPAAQAGRCRDAGIKTDSHRFSTHTFDSLSYGFSMFIRRESTYQTLVKADIKIFIFGVKPSASAAID